MTVINMKRLTQPYYLEVDAILNRLNNMGAEVPTIRKELNDKKFESLKVHKEIVDTLKVEDSCRLVWEGLTQAESMRAANLWKEALNQYQVIVTLNDCVVKRIN